MNDKDHKLIEGINRSDATAFRSVFDMHWHTIYKLALRKLPSEEDARDLTQEVFYTIWKNRANWHVSSNIAGYLKAMLRHKIYDFYAQRDKLPMMLPLDEADQYWETMFEQCNETEGDFREQNRLIKLEIDRMPEKMREIFILSRFDGLSAIEIAAKLGLSVQTVRNQISFALKRLKDKFGKHIAWILLIFFLNN